MQKQPSKIIIISLMILVNVLLSSTSRAMTQVKSPTLKVLPSPTLRLKSSPAKLWREIPDAQAQKQALNIPSWAPLVNLSLPAVVVIRTEAVTEQAPLELRGLPGPFRYFAPMPPERQQGQGSGFIINEEGYILTNQHVIEGAQKIKVTVGRDPREFDAEVIGADEPLDIALLKIKSDPKEKIKWPYLPLGNSANLQLGDPVLALGSPMGLTQSVTTGIVSHKHRTGIKPSGRDLYAEVIQLQIPINPGNSGGPIVDVSGRVVGISESIMASGQAIAFCLPIDIAKEMIPQLLAKGGVERSFLGVDPEDLNPRYAKELGLSLNEKGAVVVQVMPNTPAEKAGLKPMDVILEIDGQKVSDSFNLRQLTAYKGVGQVISLKVFRKGEKGDGLKMITARLEKRPGQTAPLIRPEREQSAKVMLESVGLEVVDTPEPIRLELGLAATNPGAQIVGVMRRSSAEFAALKPGDVITRVDGISITSAKQLQNLVEKADKEKTFMMLTRRGNAERFVPLEKR